MRALRTMLTRSVLLIGLAVVATAWPSGTSTAGATEPGWLTVPGGLPLFDLAALAPGDTGSATLTVTNPQPFPVNVSIGVTALATDDNGCNEPEQAIGDTTCGAGGGELQFDLRLTLTDTSRIDRPIIAGTVVEWASRPAIDTAALLGHDTRTYRVAYELPIGSSNLTQSDLVAFAFEVRLDQVIDSVASEPPAALVVATPALPGTGADVLAIVLVGVAAVVSGIGFYRWSLRRRQSS